MYFWYEENEIVYFWLFYIDNGMVMEDSGMGFVCVNLGVYYFFLN